MTCWPLPPPTVHGLHLGPAERDTTAGRQMAPPLSAKPKWDSNLILQRTLWPQKAEAFTVSSFLVCWLVCVLACLFVCSSAKCSGHRRPRLSWSVYFLFVCLFVCVLACLFVCLFVCLFLSKVLWPQKAEAFTVSSFFVACLFVCLFACLFACRSCLLVPRQNALATEGGSVHGQFIVCLLVCLLVPRQNALATKG